MKYLLLLFTLASFSLFMTCNDDDDADADNGDDTEMVDEATDAVEGEAADAMDAVEGEVEAVEEAIGGGK